MQPAKPRVFQSEPRRITTVWTPGGSEPRPPRYALLPDAVTAWGRARLQPLVRYADACRPTHTTTGVHGGVHRATTAYPVRDVLCGGQEASGAVHEDCEELPQMRAETMQLVRQAVGAGRRAYVLVNNRAEGNAPLTVQGLVGMLHG